MTQNIDWGTKAREILGQRSIEVDKALMDHDPEAEAASARAMQVVADQLMEAAMRRCDEHNDSEAAREEMRQDIAAVPVHQHADLLAHFRGERPDFSQGAA